LSPQQTGPHAPSAIQECVQNNQGCHAAPLLGQCPAQAVVTQKPADVQGVHIRRISTCLATCFMSQRPSHALLYAVCVKEQPALLAVRRSSRPTLVRYSQVHMYQCMPHKTVQGSHVKQGSHIYVYNFLKNLLLHTWEISNQGGRRAEMSATPVVFSVVHNCHHSVV
jgi:hypothetical protein